ncbi:MAG: hypothetical protein QM718_09810 [Steroidobacteraceae bacterium]
MSSDYEKLGVFYLGRELDAAGNTGVTPVLYDSKDLTTHAVCVGMTGSGKTGLCLSIIEEAAIDGIPALCIDPKGDIGNLMLTFPDLAASDFAPWVDAAEAARKNLSVNDYAAQAADTWKKGLADWDESGERIARLRAAADVAIYTPGGSAGLGLSILRTLAAPSAEALNDPAALREQIGTTVAALLALLGRDADPVKSRDYILLARIIESAWTAGHALDLAGIIQQIQKPPFDKLGAFDLETFYPARERLELAMAVNALLASPGFAAWLEGEPLDAQRLLFTPEGKPRIAILSIAHLSDAERMFIVTLILNELVAWMRRQSGTGSLRALFYMDEIFGYFPPTAIPPSKPPMLTLLKQARAFGLGCVLATQNPVDLDYRGLGNAGTWFIGRLQTERDKQRVVEGLTSAVAGNGLDRDALDGLMAKLAPRVFLMRNAKDDAAHLLKTRWTLSYLRGPLTSPEIGRLMQPRKTQARAVASAATAGATSEAIGSAATANAAAGSNAATRPLVAAQVHELFLTATQGSGAVEYRPMALGTAKLHFVDSTLGVDSWQTLQLLAPIADDGRSILWEEARDAGAARTAATAAPANGAGFAELPAAAARADSYSAWSKSLAAHLYETARTELLVCTALKMNSNPGESEGDFRARLALKAREQRDAQVDKLRSSYAPKLAALQDRLARAQARASVQHSQVTQQTLSTVVSVGATILGAFLGKRAISATSVTRAATAMRSATRIGQEHQESVQAEENASAVEQQLQALKTQSDGEIAAITGALDPAALTVTSAQVPARKSDIAIGEVALAWVPWRRAADGFAASAI